MRWIAWGLAMLLIAPTLARGQSAPGRIEALPPVDGPAMQMQSPPMAMPSQQSMPSMPGVGGGSNATQPPASTPAKIHGVVVPAGLTLEQVEAVALANNPTLREADARLAAAQGVAQQAGLYPNPTVGYVGDLMGASGTAGELQGGFVRQTIVTAGKLKLSRSKYLQEVAQNQLHALAQRERVLNGVRVHYIRLLSAQRLYDVQQHLLSNADDAQLTTQEMMNLGQANRAQVLQAQVAARRKRVELAQSEIAVQKARRDLAAFVGVPCLPNGPVAGSLEGRGSRLEWCSALAELINNSPELSVAQLEIRKDQIQLEREKAQPYPNIQVEAATGRNFENPSNVASANIGLEVPLFNRNQGTIRQAQAEVARASAEAHRVELALRHQLAEAFKRYDAAYASVEDFESQSIRDAQQAYDLLKESYAQRRAPWTDVLQAERIYFELSQEYVHDLCDLREAEIAIKGLLLVGGLEAPGAPVGNHIDATPQPR
jgi:outer membrane protein, heavy metal efflux system